MAEKQKISHGLIVAFAFIVGALMLYALSPVLGPFFVGLGLAYLLHPLVDKAACGTQTRGWVSLAVVLFLMVLFIGAWFLLLPFLAGQVEFLLRKGPSFIEHIAFWAQSSLEKIRHYTSLHTFLVGNGENMLYLTARKALGWIGNYSLGFLSGFAGVPILLFYLLVTPFVCFYGLKDWQRLMAFLRDAVPFSMREHCYAFFSDLNQAIGTYLRGQALVCICMAVYMGVLFPLIGVPNGLGIGILTGLLVFFPYVGIFFGMLIAFLLTLAHAASMQTLLGLCLVFMGGQILETGFLVPFFVGKRVGLHPVWTVFSLFAAGVLLGGWGVFLALPLVLCVRTAALWALRFYKQSDFFRAREKTL